MLDIDCCWFTESEKPFNSKKAKKRKQLHTSDKVKAKKAKFDPTQIQTVTQLQAKLIEKDEQTKSEWPWFAYLSCWFIRSLSFLSLECDLLCVNFECEEEI